MMEVNPMYQEYPVQCKFDMPMFSQLSTTDKEQYAEQLVYNKSLMISE